MNSFALGLVASAVAIGTALTPALAQTMAPGSTTAAPGSTMAAPGSTPPAAAGAPMGTMSGPATRTGTMPAAGTPGSMAAPGGQAAASGNDNQAVATTAANASTPAHGANSFTMGEARRRIAARGYTHVANLKKDSGGVWRGTAQKDGASTGVWLDYKGNIGQQAS